ncbi:histidine phosphatase family protein [Filobacillus milosensis]|uniref:Histidine phosphatase family protein n=1 Tax=Filobacillus milosensis TaxID=94137 RepID=A0A4Y8IN90_9BACI|nr:histidine phosphatase family protein [Filobacillus milosensis]TFB22915.1 histidine phosphatase family protein [Filobacillus milosensis]
MTLVYFVRHAHSTYTPDELGRPLSEKGFLQAQDVRHILKDYKFDVVLSSPYKRAVQTVEGVAKDRDLEVEVLDGFKERRLAGEPVKDFDSAIQQVWRDEFLSLPGGESNHAAQKRGVNTLNQVLNQYRGKSIVIGTHGNIMTLIMQYFDSRFDFDFWKTLAMPDVLKLEFEDNNLLRVNRLWEDQIQ